LIDWGGLEGDQSTEELQVGSNYMRNAPLPPISPSNTALVLHDMQYDFMQATMAEPAMVELIKRTQRLIELARSLSMPVIYTRYETDPQWRYSPKREPYLHRHNLPIVCVKGTRGADVIDELRPTDDDYIITKLRSSVFYSTRLESLLQIKDRWILVVAGGSVNWGIQWLARDANVRDLVTVVLRDCTYSRTKEIQNANLEEIDDFIGYVMNSDDVVERLSAAKG
jgi:nicotinamidase-related amidase